MRVRWNTLGMNLLRESDVKRKIALNQIKKQIETLSTFMPDEILNMPLSELEDVQTFVGVLLFADVSGFTPLCEKYNKTGKGGIYRLTATLNAYIGALVEVITFYGGDILKFSGDAFLALWKAPPELRLFEVIHQVIVCALFIQNTLGRFDTEVNVQLKVKLAIACGNLTFSVIGNQTHRHYIIVGPAINDVKAAEHASTSGDVVVAPSAWGHLSEDNYEVSFGENGNVKIWNCVYFPNQYHLKDQYASKYVIAHSLCVKHLQHRSELHQKRRIDDATTGSKLTESFIASLPERAAVKRASSTWIPNDLNPFIIRPVQNQVEEKQPIEYLTEMRQVTIQFINIVSSTFQESKLVPMVNRAYQTVCKIVSAVRGVVNKVSLFDKDCMLLVLFGLRGIEHELESQNALKSGFAIRKSIKRLTTVKSISVGITNGWVYCGVVGHPFRREYTVIGGAVNKAARIMCAYEDKVTCDHETYKSCKLSSLYFQLQSALKLKGIASAGHIFEYNEDFDKMEEDKREELPLFGREAEMQLVASPGINSICFKGEGKVGKSKLLQAISKKYSSDDNQIVCSLVLSEALRRSFYTIGTIYHDLYDIQSQKNPTVIAKLPRELWNWTEMIQSQITTSGDGVEPAYKNLKNLIKHTFVKICEGKVKPIIIIDNVEYIDNRSLEILALVLQKQLVRLIAAGCFEENTTWNTMWKITLIKQVTVVNVEPLGPTETVLLVCSFLNVKGVSKKLIYLINRTCEGRPGWVQACLLKMINNGELEMKYASSNEKEYVFLTEADDKSIALVAGFSIKYLEHSEEASTAITLDLFDSFTAYEQLVIKTAAVLGEIFSRTTLIVLLKYPNETTLANAIKTLFEEDIFDCASRYINSGGLHEKKNVCLCYVEDEEINTTLDLPRYSFCKLIHFRSRNLRNLAYELLPLNQKKEFHLRITDLLETQNNSCPNCLRDNSASIIVVRKFRDLVKYCHDQKYYVWSESSGESEHPLAVYQKIIRDVVQNPTKRHHRSQGKVSELPKRKVWDPTTCFCLEILMNVYRDLIHHSHCSEHLGKKIFFMLQYGTILFNMHEFDDSIRVLHEASELCMVQINKVYVFTGSFKKVMMGKIHRVLGAVYLSIGNLVAAKNHAILSLRQYDVPMISFKYSLPHILINRVGLKPRLSVITRQDNPLIKLDFALCMGLVSQIYAAEGRWKFAKLAAIRSVRCLKHTNANLDVLCDIYTDAMYLHSFCGDLHICEKLERCFNRNALMYYTNNVTKELFAICRVLNVLFLIKVLSGTIEEAIHLGFRALYTELIIQAHYFLLETIPPLAKLLATRKRIDEAVFMGTILFNIGKKFNADGYVAYYAFCLELILETNFYLEPVDKIEQFASQHIDPKKKATHFGNWLVLNLYAYHLRSFSPKRIYWKRLISISVDENFFKLMSLVIMMRYTECLLIEMVHSLQQRKPILPVEEEDIKHYFLKKLNYAANKWEVFKPKYLHLKAYHCKIKNKNRQCKRLLKKANDIAVKQENILAESWIMLSSCYWFGGYPFEDQHVEPKHWRTAKTYTPLQWSLLMYPLPYC